MWCFRNFIRLFSNYNDKLNLPENIIPVGTIAIGGIGKMKNMRTGLMKPRYIITNGSKIFSVSKSSLVS